MNVNHQSREATKNKRKKLEHTTRDRSIKYDRPGECSPEKDLSGSHHQSQVNCESSVNVISLWSFS